MPTIDQLVDDMLTAADRGDYPEANRIGDLIDTMHGRQLDQLTRPVALASSALWYATRGIAVFPVQPRGKVPLVKWRDEATTDPAKVAAWWRAWPDANIGMPTGLRWDVIDIDGPAGYQSFGLLREQGMLPPRAGRSTTPRGGMHIFITADGAGNAAGFQPGLDYRGLGGYVVLPPSVGANGKLYLWDEPVVR